LIIGIAALAKAPQNKKGQAIAGVALCASAILGSLISASIGPHF
jgi:hypothetical protein